MDLPQDIDQATSRLTKAEAQQTPRKNDRLEDARENLYRRHFAVQVNHAPAPTTFIKQVDGFGVQIYAQASSFGAR